MADVDSSKLKPCPFCGGKAHATTADPAVRQPEFIMCLACLAEIEGPGAIEQWNDRHDVKPATRAELEAVREMLLARIAELELLADDARGKRCPECSAPMVSLSTIDGGQRVCSGCDKVWSWHLKEGQPPLIGNNRMVKRV